MLRLVLSGFPLPAVLGSECDEQGHEDAYDGDHLGPIGEPKMHVRVVCRDQVPQEGKGGYYR